MRKDDKDKKVDFMIQKDNKIKAIYKDDLSIFLEKIHKYEDFNNRKIECRYCGVTLVRQNLYAIIPCSDHFEFCCTESECMNTFVEEANDG